jgi:hypothetical protein
MCFTWRLHATETRSFMPSSNTDATDLLAQRRIPSPDITLSSPSAALSDRFGGRTGRPGSCAEGASSGCHQGALWRRGTAILLDQIALPHGYCNCSVCSRVHVLAAECVRVGSCGNCVEMCCRREQRTYLTSRQRCGRVWQHEASTPQCLTSATPPGLQPALELANTVYYLCCYLCGTWLCDNRKLAPPQRNHFAI